MLEYQEETLTFSENINTYVTHVTHVRRISNLLLCVFKV